MHTVGKTLAINWLPVTDSAKSTIIALRDLFTIFSTYRITRETNNVPFRRLAHPLDDFIQCLLPAFLQRLRNRLGTLLIRRKLEKAFQQMPQRHLAVFIRAMFED
jgi:hypothetical protein